MFESRFDFNLGLCLGGSKADKYEGLIYFSRTRAFRANGTLVLSLSPFWPLRLFRLQEIGSEFSSS